MLNSQDQENLLKSSHAASFLVQDLNALAKADNPLLAELAIELLQQASQLEQRLKRLESLTR